MEPICASQVWHFHRRRGGDPPTPVSGLYHNLSTKNIHSNVFQQTISQPSKLREIKTIDGNWNWVYLWPIGNILGIFFLKFPCSELTSWPPQNLPKIGFQGTTQKCWTFAKIKQCSKSIFVLQFSCKICCWPTLAPSVTRTARLIFQLVFFPILLGGRLLLQLLYQNILFLKTGPVTSQKWQV